MSLLERTDLTHEQKERYFLISQVFLLYYEVYTNKKSGQIRFEDSNEIIFNRDKFTFGRLVLQLFSVFNVPLKHLPLKEFQLYKTVDDLVDYIYENSKDNE